MSKSLKNYITIKVKLSMLNSLKQSWHCVLEDVKVIISSPIRTSWSLTPPTSSGCFVLCPNTDQVGTITNVHVSIKVYASRKVKWIPLHSYWLQWSQHGGGPEFSGNHLHLHPRCPGLHKGSTAVFASGGSLPLGEVVKRCHGTMCRAKSQLGQPYLFLSPTSFSFIVFISTNQRIPISRRPSFYGPADAITQVYNGAHPPSTLYQLYSCIS